MRGSPGVTECHPDRKHRGLGLCESCYRKAYRKAHPERVRVPKDKEREKNARARARRRAAVLLAYGGKCECCGEAEPKFLQLDHINGGGVADRRSGITCFTLDAIRLGFPKDKYRLLCANCNVGRHINGGICPHQEAA